MSLISTNVLSKMEAESIHKTSLQVLGKIGVEIADDAVRARLIKAGAKAGSTSQRVTFSEKMITEALSKCPRDIELISACEKKYSLANGNRLYSSCLVDPFMFDFADGKRSPEIKDCVNNAKLVDSIDTISFPYKMDINYSDCSPEQSVYLSNYALMSIMSKPYLCGPHNVAEAKIWIEMSQIMTNGHLKNRRLLCSLVSPISPLTFDKDFIDLVDYLAPSGAVLVVLPCPMSGATSPITLAGTVVTFNCELLASIVMIQTLHPGTPVVYHTCAHSFNMATTQASLGGPEKILLGVATACMGNYYNLPCGTAGSSTDAGNYDMQNGAESMSQLLMAVNGPATIVTGIGSMASGNGTSAEQILFDCELIELARFLGKGIIVDTDRLACEVIESVGPGGNFLMEDHTLKYLKANEHFLKGSFDRTSQNSSESKMYATLHEKSRNLIESHRSQVPESKIKELQNYLIKNNVSIELLENYIRS